MAFFVKMIFRTTNYGITGTFYNLIEGKMIMPNSSYSSQHLQMYPTIFGSLKKQPLEVFLKISQNSQENTCAGLQFY